MSKQPANGSESWAQLIATFANRGVQDTRVLQAMCSLPRDAFLDEPIRMRAADDSALPIGYGQTVSQPYVVALMTSYLHLRPEETVLEVGTGSGYQAAILARLCREVVTIERIPELHEQAARRLRQVGAANVHCVLGDGAAGYAAKAPYDAIMITAASESVPAALVRQLGRQGRLIAPIGGRTEQRLHLITISTGRAFTTDLMAVRFVPLISDTSAE